MRKKFIVHDKNDPYVPETFDWLLLVTGTLEISGGIIYLTKYMLAQGGTGGGRFAENYHFLLIGLIMVLNGTVFCSRSFGVTLYSREDGFVPGSIIKT